MLIIKCIEFGLLLAAVICKISLTYSKVPWLECENIAISLNHERSVHNTITIHMLTYIKLLLIGDNSVNYNLEPLPSDHGWC